MDFKFGFFDESTEEGPTDVSGGNETFIGAEDIAPVESSSTCANNILFPVQVSPDFVVDLWQSKEVSGIASKTDVEPGVYEGGFKLWECSVDLTRLLHATALSNPSSLEGKRVLDLGCGHGLPGVYCAMLGCFVWFQDLNREVLVQQTMVNVERNCVKRNVKWKDKNKFVAGDWRALLTSESEVLLPVKGFDVIVTAETVYNEAMYPVLHELFDRYLKEDGVILVAAKRFYFGVGGGGTSFKEFVEKKGIFMSNVVAKYEDGISNVRDVIEFKRR